MGRTSSSFRSLSNLELGRLGGYDYTEDDTPHHLPNSHGSCRKRPEGRLVPPLQIEGQAMARRLTHVA